MLGLLAVAGARAQAPVWQRAISFGSGNSTTWATVSDAAGNVYIAGGFEGTATFGATSLSSAGDMDAFLAKWSPQTQSFVWARQLGGAGHDYIQALALSGNSLYLTGNFTSATLP